MRAVLAFLLAGLATTLLSACPGLSASQKAEFKSIQDKVPELRPYALDIDAMAQAYKPIHDKAEGKVRPRMLATVLSVLPADAPEAAQLARENNLPEVPGAQVAIVYTPQGWAVMQVKPGLEVKQGQVVEFTWPAAADFSDLDDTEAMQTTLTDLQRQGSVGIQSVRSDCVGNTSGQGPFAMSCNGSPAEFVVNADQFTATTLAWLNSPVAGAAS